MLKPTSQRLFQLSSTWSFLKLHQPLPLSNRDSQQLLNLLTTSFRQQLDQEHGAVANKLPQSGCETRSVAHKRRDSTSAPRAHPTDLHLNNILTNPLFTHPSKKTSKKILRPDNGTRQSPMDIFDKACAGGLMTVARAHGCLLAHKKAIQDSPATSVTNALRDSGAGGRVLSWLSSNGLINTELFLHNPQKGRIGSSLSILLIECLVAENSGDIVWHWLTNALDSCIKCDQISPVVNTDSNARLVAHLLEILIIAQAACHVTLDKSYMTLDKYIKYLQHNLGEGVRENSNFFIRLIHRSASWLSWQSTMKSAHLPATESNYDTFMDHISLIISHPQYKAHLALHHPTKRSTTAALKLLRERSTGTERKLTGPDIQSRHTMRHIAMGLDTAKALLEQSEPSNAKWVMNYLSTTYPVELGIKTTLGHDLALAKAEADTLDLLKGLDLAY